MWSNLSSSTRNTSQHEDRSLLSNVLPPKPIQFSLESFPSTASVKNETGIPWGAVITPYTSGIWRSGKSGESPTGSSIRRHLSHTRAVYSNEVPKCQVCGGWLNSTCMMQRDNWHCSMCGQWNAIDGTRQNHSKSGVLRDHRYPEMNQHWAEFRSGDCEKHQIIAHVIVLDLSIASATNGEESKEARLNYFMSMRKGLIDSIQNMSKNTWVALMCVDDSSKVTVCDIHSMRGRGPSFTATSTTTTTTTSTVIPRFLKSYVSEATGTLQTPLVDLLQGTKLACKVGCRRQSLILAVQTLLSGAIDATNRIKNTNTLHVQQQCSKRIATTTRACILGLMEYLSSPPPSSSSCRGDPTYVQSIVAARVSLVTPGWSSLQQEQEQQQQHQKLQKTATLFSYWKTVQHAMATCGVCLDVFHGDAAFQLYHNTDDESSLLNIVSKLSLSTGGRVRSYTNAMDQYESLSFDLKANIGVQYAACGVLHVRTSDGFRVAVPKKGSWGEGSGGNGALGWCEPVDDILGVDVQFHFAGCDRSTCFPLSFTTDVGLGSGSSSASSVANPIIQLCYVYYSQEREEQQQTNATPYLGGDGEYGFDEGTSTSVFSTSSFSSGNSSSRNVSSGVRKWTRVITIRCGSTSQTARTAMTRADTESLFYILAHQVFTAETETCKNETEKNAVMTSTTTVTTQEGKNDVVKETQAGTLLFDWLVYLMSSYYRKVLNITNDDIHHVIGCHELSLTHLTPLTQLVYGLLQFLRRRRRRMGQFRKDLDEFNGNFVNMLSLSPTELMRRVYPRIEIYDQQYRKIKLMNQRDNIEPWILLEWSTLKNIMTRSPNSIMLVDTGKSVRLLRNNQGITLKVLKEEERKGNEESHSNVRIATKNVPNTIEIHLQQRRLTSTSAPMVCNMMKNSKTYIERFRNNCCLNDGDGLYNSGIHDTYRSFIEKLKQKVKSYLKGTSN
jgi:hypothetical protein